MRYRVMRWLMCTLLVSPVLQACSAEDAPVATRGGPSTSPVIGAQGRCTTNGPSACYCEDGTLSGTQTCVSGALTSCSCPGASAAQAPSAPEVLTMPSATALCRDLAAASGCMAQSYESSEVPASILFVLDRSGSMACNPPPLQDSASCEASAAPADGTQPSKWQITVDALEQVMSDLLANNSKANVGLSFFSNDNTCGVHSAPSVPVAPLTMAQAAALTNTLEGTVPSGGTPMVGATTLAYAYLHQEANAAPGCSEPCGAPGNRYVVVITDGADSCPMPMRPQDAAECAAAGSCTDYLVQKAAPLATGANIRTFVIGAPGSEPARGYLSELAWVGGTARNPSCNHDASAAVGDCHYDMTSTADFADALALALGDVSGAALGCEFAVPQTNIVVTKGSVNVQYRPSQGDPQCFAYDDAACEAGSNGWQFAKLADGTPDLSRVVLCGSACDKVRADKEASVDVILGCETIELL